MKYVVGHYDKLDSCSVLFFRIESDGTIPLERPQKKTQLARASTITGTIVLKVLIISKNSQIFFF